MADDGMNRSWGGLSPYEDYKISEMVSRRPNGGTVTALVLGSVGLAAGLVAMVYPSIFANAKAKGVRDLANARYDATNAQLATLAGLLATERNERVAQGLSVTQTINDTISGQQTSNLTAQQQSELSAVNNVMAQTYSDFVTGRASLNPTPVSLYSAPAPCGCPCNG